MSDEGHDSMPDTDHTGHAGHAHHVDQFRRLFWIMLVLAVPVVVLDPMFAHLLGYHLPDNVVVGWIPPLLGTVLYAVGGRPFLTGAIGELRSRKPGMMLLIGFAITVAFVSSWGAFIGILDSDLGFWWELALLVVIMLLGHWIEMGSLARSGSALESLASLLPDEAQRVTDDDRTETVPVDGLRVGDVVLVRPGSAVPADGTVLAGEANVDESMVTGESTPVRRGEEDRVVAGTIATDSALRVRVTATGEDTALAGIRRLVADAQSSSSRAQRLGDHGGRLARRRATRPGRGPRDHRARDRLPARPGSGDPARRLDRHGTCSPRRRAGHRPTRPRGHAHSGHRPVRQDRNPHPWGTRTHGGFGRRTVRWVRWN
jgi:Cu2+-exporting ATPase